jgi:hypothetical protein
MKEFQMKPFTNSRITKWSGELLALLMAVASLTACSSISPTPGPADQPQLAVEAEKLERLKSAEYQDYMTAMTFENSNQKLGNYYAAKGSQVHHLIDQMEEGHQVNYTDIRQALDNSESAKYDDRPPVPLDDMTGNGY